MESDLVYLIGNVDLRDTKLSFPALESFICRFQILYRTVTPQFFDSGAPRAELRAALGRSPIAK